MCGIAGAVSYHLPLGQDAVAGLVEGIAHRGPDDRGTHVSPDGMCALGHTRLAILDLSPAGHQPMLDADTGSAIVFNGEIYNFAALRKACEADGYRFRSHSDTEVILALYRRHGTACLQFLRGMYAFAIWDPAQRRLFFARDRVGKKPFHYAASEAGFVFSSEIDPLARHPWTDRRLDHRALDYYLHLQTVPAPHTIYTGIRKLPPAHYGIVESGRLTIERYWEPDYRDKLSISDDDALDAFEEKLTESVRLRMVADVPVGALLSGGVDSSLVVSIMAKQAGLPIRTFSVGFGEPAVDESAYAQQAAEICGTVHRPLRMDAPLVDELPTLVRRYGEPYADYSALPSFFVCAGARQEVTVVLNGDGGDELLGGYPRYALSDHAIARASRLQSLLPFPVERQASWLLKPARFPFRKVRRLLLQYLTLDGASIMMYHGVGTDGERRALLPYDHSETNLKDWRLRWLKDARRNTDNPIDGMLWIDNHTYLPDDLLVKMDIASMHCGLEARSPFLDHELIELCARLPVKQKVRGGVGKFLIKKLAERHFPPEFVHRRKMGFGIPLKSWLHGPLHSLVKDVLLDPSSMAPLRHDVVGRHFAEFERRTYSMEPLTIWTLLMYGLWRRHCYLR